MQALRHNFSGSLSLSEKIEIILEESYFNWNIVRNFVSNFPFCFDIYNISVIYMSKDSRRHFIELATVLLELIAKYSCSDVSIISDVLEVLCLVCSEASSTYTFNHCIDVQLRISNRRCKQFVTPFEKILKFPYREVPKSVSKCIDPVRDAVNCGNLGLLQNLLWFGAILITPIRSSPSELYLVSSVMKSLSNENTHRDIDLFAFQNFHSEFKAGAMQRVLFMMRIMEIFIKIRLEPHDADKYKDCIRMLFQSIPESCISSEEIRRSLGKLFLGICPYEDVIKIAETYEFHFPESRQVSKPRSLQHLCRIQLRENLRVAGTLPHGVASLPLPKILQKYILLKEKNFPLPEKSDVLYRPKRRQNVLEFL